MRVIAIVNQKGGCGKTTTTVNLGGALAADGSRVLIIDLDPQAHATLALGIDPDELEQNLYEILVEYHDTNKPIDLISLTQVLMDRSQLDNVGGAAALADIYSFAPSTAHFEFYLDIIKGKTTLRLIIQACTESITRAYEDQEDIPGLLDEV